MRDRSPQAPATANFSTRFQWVRGTGLLLALCLIGPAAGAQRAREGWEAEEPRWIPSIDLGFDAFEYRADSAVENKLNPPHQSGKQSSSPMQFAFQFGAELMGPMFEGVPGRPRLFVQAGARYKPFESNKIFDLGDLGNPEGRIRGFGIQLENSIRRGCQTNPNITCPTAVPEEFDGQGSEIRADLSNPSWYAAFGVAFNVPVSRSWLFQIKPMFAYSGETVDMTGKITTVTEPEPEVFQVHRSVARESATDHSIGPGLELALGMFRSTRPITATLYANARFMWLISDSTTAFEDSAAAYRVDRDKFGIRGGAGVRFSWMGFER